ncbi:MAG: transglycosylase SLT domain-containing protein [Bacillota bacterium]|nr:transglycosylase SLT domain-containing protein [Bacillota bacterium]
MTILLLSFLSAYATETGTEGNAEPEVTTVQGSFFIRNVDINGVTIENYYLEDPLFLYQNVTYLPLTAELGEILGIEAEMDLESHTLKILKTEATRTHLTEKVLKSNLQNVSAIVAEDVAVTAYYEPEPLVLETPLTASRLADHLAHNVAALLADEIISIPELMALELETEDLPVLLAGDVYYVPVRMFTESGAFGWSVYYDEYSGIYISTDPKIEAVKYFDQEESEYNRGLTEYILSQNKWISRAGAEELVFIFKHEADVNEIDITLLMALARRESTFQAGIVSSGGAVGVMQIMPSTGELFGYTYEQLLTPHYNIEMGAMYISRHLDNYGGNATTALSAYNMGSRAVSRGGYRTVFAEKVLNTHSSIESYLESGGYTE